MIDMVHVTSFTEAKVRAVKRNVRERLDRRSKDERRIDVLKGDDEMKALWLGLVLSEELRGGTIQ